MIYDFNNYLKRVTVIGVVVGIVLVSSLFVSISFLVWGESQERQIQPWIEIFPQNVLTHLVESDYHPISSKVRLIQKTKLFKYFAIYDSNRDWIDGFGISSSLPLSKDAHLISDESGKSWGWFVYSKDTSERFYFLKLISIMVLCLSIFFTILINFSFDKFVATKIARFSDFIDSIEKISQEIKSANTSNVPFNYAEVLKNVEFQEGMMLSRSIEKLIAEINLSKQRFFDEQVESQKNRIFSDVARQVAHDIRSPLSALSMALSGAKIEEERADLVNQAIKRISDIAFDLLSRSRVSEVGAGRQPLSSNRQSIRFDDVFDLPESLRCIFKEKRALAGARHIALHLDFENVLVRGERVQFERVLSNLIQNAIEATSNSQESKIEITAVNNNSYISVGIVDNGVGIPAHILEKINNQEPVSFGKANGNGLGISNAIATMKSWGGSFQIASQVGSGSLVQVNLSK